ncbi:MAG TPA: hypothetical protein VFE23_18395 [Usitatibacter sp.]|jgi:hypothetical protein|nr:hypothetical protein [Usitatibacter sp.]
MTNTPSQLLRRTFLGILALAAFAAAPAQAQVSKSEGGSLCSTYTGITILPNGAITISGCDGSVITPPPPPTPGAAGTFSIAGSSTALGWNVTSGSSFTVTRTGGTTGSVTVNYNRGGGCGPLPLDDTVTFADGVTTANLTVRTPNNDAFCVFTLTGISGGVGATSAPVIGTASAQVAVTSSGTNTPPPPSQPPGGQTPSGCATNVGIPATVNFGGNDIFRLPSGQIAYMPLPDVQTIIGRPSGVVQFNDTSSSPQAGMKEVWISKCPGAAPDASVTNPPAGKCYVSSSSWGGPTGINWFEAQGSDPAHTDAVANSQINSGAPVCEAYASTGQWYVNFRLTYQPGDCQWGTCSVTGQWNFSGFTP